MRCRLPTRAENAQALQQLAIFIVDDLAIERVPVDGDAIGDAGDGALECAQARRISSASRFMARVTAIRAAAAVGLFSETASSS